MFKKKFKEDMFESELIIIIDSPENLEFISKLDNFDGYYNWDGVIYICDDAPLLKTLSHELIHFVHYQLKDMCDISLTDNTEETYAYFYSYYLDKIWERMSALQIKNEKK